MAGRDYDFGSVIKTLVLGVIGITFVVTTLLVLGVMSLLGATIQTGITLQGLLITMAGLGLVFGILPFNPISAFYSALRMPIRAFNNLIESALIHRISLENAPRLKSFLLMLYSMEAVIGIAGVQMLVIAPIATALVPAVGSVVGSMLGFSLAVYNAFKLSSWVIARMENFDRSMLERRWRRDWLVQEQIPVETRIENARRNQQRFHINPDPVGPNPARVVQEQQDLSFGAVWQKAMETKDLKELFARLQVQYGSSYSRQLHLTPEMQTAYALNTNNGDGFWANIPAKKIAEIEDNDVNKDLCDPISLRFMRIPVLVETASGTHRFDLIQLLHCLSVKGENPLNRDPITDLRTIKFDEETYSKIRKVVNKAELAARREMIIEEIKTAPLVYAQALESVKARRNATIEQDTETAVADKKLVRRASFYL